MERKDEALSYTKVFIAEAETQTGLKLKRFRTDGGGEYVGHEFRDFLREKGIVHEKSTAYTPQQNGVAERFNKVIVSMFHAMILQAQCPRAFWPEATVHAGWILNRVVRDTKKGSPFEQWWRKRPDLSTLRRFGCVGWVMNTRPNLPKLQSKAKKMMFIGFTDGVKGWRFYDEVRNQIVTSRDVVFDEEQLFYPSLSSVGGTFNASPQLPEAASAPNETDEDDEASENETVVGKSDLHETSRSKDMILIEDSDSDPEVETSIVLAKQARPLPQSPTRSRASEIPPWQVEAEVEAESIAETETRASTQAIPETDLPATRARTPAREEERSPKGKERQEEMVPEPEPTTPPRSMNVVQPPTRPRKSQRTTTAILFPPEKPPSPAKEVYQTMIETVRRSSRLKEKGTAGTSRQSRPTQEEEPESGMLAVNGNQHEWLIEYALAIMHDKENLTDQPANIQEARARPDWNEWNVALLTELANHKANGTWELVPLPEGCKPIGTRWVLVIKRDELGLVDKYKARLVGQGYNQKKGIDFTETFSPVVRSGTLRLAFAIAARQGWEVHHMDVVAAYLNGELDIPIYAKQPPGFEDGSGRVMLLKKGLYGLKQSGRLWYIKADETLKRMGFQRVQGDQGMYLMKSNGEMVILCLYVDDMVVTGTSPRTIEMVKERLKREFKMADKGLAKHILGMRVTQGKDSIQLDQEAYIKRMAARFGLQESRPTNTPLPVAFSLKDADATPTLGEHGKSTYMQIVGSLLYATYATRHDVAYATHILSRRCSCPTTAHLSAAKHTVRYLLGSATARLTFRRSQEERHPGLASYTDADWAGDHTSAKSTSGGLILFNGTPIHWSSRLQDIVTQSTKEAEVVAANEVARQVIWYRKILSQIGPVSAPTKLFCDNKQAVDYAVRDVELNRTKHLHVKYEYIREQMNVQRTIEVQWIPGEMQLADIFTKLHKAPTVQRVREALNLLQ